ncbi:hypothetical protein [Maribacter sp.]|uniref:hypothetical protein n=1 Tax=Maribacter sp. TaxID=1897614 RepID=UPI0025BE3057|nr:hypothetical protein [Maribacter sp.]
MTANNCEKSQNMKNKNILFLVCLLLSVIDLFAQNDWELKTNHIVSSWAKEVKPVSVLPEYPRPQMKRDKWMNLNGIWDYAIISNNLDKPKQFDGKILVPFAVESALSGVEKRISD